MGMIAKSCVSTFVHDLLKSYNHEGIHIPVASRDLLDSEGLVEVSPGFTSSYSQIYVKFPV